MSLARVVAPTDGTPLDAAVATRPVEWIDRILSEEGVFDHPPAQVKQLRWGLLKTAVAWHLHPAAPYAAYAARQGFSVDALDTPDGLDRIPLLPSMLLKRAGVSVQHPHADDILWTTSSGTKGSVSQIPRDDTTLRRFFSSIGNLSNEMLDVENADLRVFNLGPDAQHARTLWISYVMAGMSVMLPQGSYYVRDDRFQLEEAIRDLRACAGKRVAVIGPPAFLLELANAIAARGLVLEIRADSLFMSMGGWKRRSGQRVAREAFDDTLCAAFRVAPGQVRDTFNMVELNSVLIECAEKRLHVPPWLYVRARDPASLAALPSGAPGVLSYLDPTARSYPGFILSDDLGTVDHDSACPCGRHSDVLRIERRLNTMEARGCALKLDQLGVA